MRTEQLEYLAAVTRAGSLRRAAEQLHLSQPALSEAVSRLEGELGVTLLDRRRSGARISRAGHDLLQYMTDVLEAVDRLRSAAGDQQVASRLVRVGTVNTATSLLLFPALRQFQIDHPQASVEVEQMQQAEIHAALVEGSLDLGLVNLFDTDDPEPELRTTVLLRGRPVAVLPGSHPLADQSHVDVEDLRAERFVAMRPGFLMHRFAHRLFESRLPTTVHVSDGAELGKLAVAEGLGVTILPEFTVIGDTLERAGSITHRPISGDSTRVHLVLQQRRSTHTTAQVRGLVEALVTQARRVSSAASSSTS